MRTIGGKQVSANNYHYYPEGNHQKHLNTHFPCSTLKILICLILFIILSLTHIFIDFGVPPLFCLSTCPSCIHILNFWLAFSSVAVPCFALVKSVITSFVA